MESGILLAIISMVCFGVNGGVSKKMIREFGPIKFGFYRNITLTVMLGGMLLLNIKQTDFNLFYILMAFLLGIFIYAGFYFSNTAIQKGRLGIVLPVSSSRIIVTTILAGIILKESLHTSQYLLIFAIIMGIIMLSVNFKELKNFSFEGKGIKEAMFAAGIFGVTMTFYSMLAKILGPYLIGVMIEGMILAGCFVHSFIKKEKLTLTKLEWQTYKNPFIASMILSIIGVVLSNYAYIAGSTSIITAIAAAAPIVTTLYDRFVHKEIMNFQENLGMMVIFAGIVVLTIA